MASRYFVVQSSNKQVISAPAAGRGDAISATLNLRDRLQHFSIDTSEAANRGVYVVARSGFVLDVTGSTFAAGTPLCLYGKVPAQLNQRFHYQNGTTMAVVQSPKLFVVSSGAKIVLSTASQKWALIPIPEEFQITFKNEGKEPIVVNYDNAPSSENVKRWNVAPGATVTLPFFQGSVISAKDQAGKYVDPSPYTVSKADTITFKDNDLCKDYSGYINALTARLEALEEVVKKQQSNEAKWIRVNADKSVLKGEGLKVGKVTTADTVWTILFTTPRADANYTVVANVYHTEFWRTWPRVTNITATGFDVHFLTETKQAIAADFYKGNAGVPPLELSCIVHEL